MLVLDRPRIEALAARDPQWRQVKVDVTPARAGLSTPLHDQFGEALRLLLEIAGAVLLLACVNLGGMLLARSAARQHEMALRVSLGAGRSRIFRQVLVESLLLAMAGGAAGLIAARPAAAVLVRILTSGTRSLAAPPQLEIGLDVRVLLFTLTIAVLAAVAFGAAPAVAAVDVAPARALRAGGTPPRSRRAFANGLVVAQVAISLTLVSVAQLYADHLRHLRDRSLGFDRSSVLLVSVDTSRGGRNREQLLALYREAKTRLQAIPGVRSVSASGMTPISGAAGSRFLRADGFEEPAQERRRVALNTISAEYFATYGTPLVAGRDFGDADLGQRRVIVNQALARHYFAGRDPIGRHVWIENERDPYDIVGVAGDAKYQDVRVAAPPIVYLFVPISNGSTNLSLQTSVPPAWLAADAGRVVNGVFGAGSVRRVTTLAEQVDGSIVPERLMAALSGFFGIAGAILAAVGLYGLLAYTVARRTREIGVRMALGATRGAVVRLVLAHAMWLVVGGLLLGVPVAFWADLFAASSLVHVPSTGPLPVAVAAVAMIAVALLAAYVPAWRATSVEPVIALRAE
jgi:predicted permease